MTIYTGEVISNTVADYPFLAILTDAGGKVVGEFPVRTEADGEAKIMEELRRLEDKVNQAAAATLARAPART